jgi:hypothetical protein
LSEAPLLLSHVQERHRSQAQNQGLLFTPTFSSFSSQNDLVDAVYFAKETIPEAFVAISLTDLQSHNFAAIEN